MLELAGRQLQLGVEGGGPVERLADRLAGEVQADASPVGLGLAAGVVVHLDDDVGASGQGPADALGQRAGLDAGRPAAQVAGDRLAGPGEARVARAGIGRVALPRLARDVDVGQDVVDDPAIADPVLDRRDVLILLEAGRDDEASIDVVARGRDREVGADVDDQVGLAERPVVGELGGGRQVARVALGGPGFGPGDEGGDVLLRERPLVLELEPEVRRGLPGGHGPLLDHRGDVRRALPGLLVGLEGERGDLTLAVALLAVLLEERRDVLGVGRDAAGASGIGQPTASTCGTATSLPASTAAIASFNSLPAGVAFRTLRATNWSSIRPW